MKMKKISQIYEIQTNRSLNQVLQEIHDSLTAKQLEVTDNEWTSAIAKEVGVIDLNDSGVINEIAQELQKGEKRKRTGSAPGVGRNLELEACTKDWAENNGIAYKDGTYVPWSKAKSQHSFEYLKQRQKNVSAAADALDRAFELHELASEKGGLAGAMKRRNIEGW